MIMIFFISRWRVNDHEDPQTVSRFKTEPPNEDNDTLKIHPLLLKYLSQGFWAAIPSALIPFT